MTTFTRPVQREIAAAGTVWTTEVQGETWHCLIEEDGSAVRIAGCNGWTPSFRVPESFGDWGNHASRNGEYIVYADSPNWKPYAASYGDFLKMQIAELRESCADKLRDLDACVAFLEQHSKSIRSPGMQGTVYGLLSTAMKTHHTTTEPT